MEMHYHRSGELIWACGTREGQATGQLDQVTCKVCLATLRVVRDEIVATPEEIALENACGDDEALPVREAEVPAKE